MDLVALVIPAIVISLLHGLIPSHWAPFVILGRERGWSRSRTVFATFLGGLAHLSSTIMVGVAVGGLGYALSQRYEEAMHWVAPAILIAVGGWVIWRGHRCHHEHGGGEHAAADGGHDHDEKDATAESKKCTCGHERLSGQDIAALGALCVMMFFSPCLELEAYYPQVAVRGRWLGIAAVSMVYLVVTIGVMMAAVAVASKKLEQVRWAFVTRHERLLSGGLLVLLGVVWVVFPH